MCLKMTLLYKQILCTANVNRSYDVVHLHKLVLKWAPCYVPAVIQTTKLAGRRNRFSEQIPDINRTRAYRVTRSPIHGA